MTVKLWGGGGGGGGAKFLGGIGFAGGSGGFTSCTLNVIPGQILNLIVAGGGQSNGYGLTGYGGYGGGGRGHTRNGDGNWSPGGGGGRSAIRLSELGDDIATAGGGGGGGGRLYEWSTGIHGGLCGGGLNGCSPSPINSPRSGSGAGLSCASYNERSWRPRQQLRPASPSTTLAFDLRVHRW